MKCIAQIFLLHRLNKGNVDNVNTYEPSGEHPLENGNVEDEGRGGKMRTSFI
jgi:hypothetical protein